MTLRSLGVLLFSLVGFLPAPAGARSADLPSLDDTWLRVETANFTLYGNASEPTIREVGLDLERLRAVLLRVTEGLSAGSPLPTFVYVFASDASLAPYKPLLDGKPRSLSAYFVPAKDGNFIALAASAGGVRSRTVYHEYLHFLMRNNLPPQPRWYDEGLAEYYSSFRAAGTRAHIGLPVEEHRTRLRGAPLMPLETLFGVGEESSEYTERAGQGLFYAQSWALVHYLMHGDADRKSQLGSFLAALQAGRPVEEAVSSHFGTDSRRLLSELSRYVRADRFPHAVVDLDGVTVREGTRSAPMARPDVLVHLGNLLARISDESFGRAEAHFRAVLSADPCHPDALAGMGVVRMRQEREEEAEVLLRSAMEAGSRDFRVPFHYGFLLLRALPPAEGTAGGKERALLDSARGAFRRSLELNGEFLEARAALGRTYLWEEGEAVRGGLSDLEEAVRGLRSRTDLAMDLVSLYEATGQEGKAEGVLRDVLGGNADRVIDQKRRTAAFRRALRRVNELLAERKETEALALLESLVAATSAELREALELQVAPLRRGIARNLAVRRYNEAIEKVGVPDYEGALAAFREVAATAENAELAEKARARAEQIRQYIDWQKKQRRRPKV